MSISLDDILAAVAELEEEEEAKPKPKPKPKTPKKRNRKPTVPTHLLIHLHVDQMLPVARIAEEVKLHPSTVLRRLRDEGVYRGPEKKGAPQLEKCKRGHDLAVHGVHRKKNGGRNCQACERVRYHERKDQDA